MDNINNSNKNKLAATSQNFYRNNTEMSNDNHIQNYYNVQKTVSAVSDNYNNNPTNQNQSPKMQSGKLRSNIETTSNYNNYLINLYIR